MTPEDTREALVARLKAATYHIFGEHGRTIADAIQYLEAADQLAAPVGEQEIERVIQAVAELPDRTSPDDWPDAMLVTADELRDILRRPRP